MAKTRFVNDRGLTSRMVFVLFLMGLLYVAVVAGLIAVGFNFVFVLVIAAAVLFAQWYFSDKIALLSMGAREVTEQDEPELYGMVQRLTTMANMPMPRLAVSNVPMPNAFATGRNPKNAVLCVTRDLVQRLDKNELEGVLAHELSHVAHRDVAVMTIASFLGVLAGLVFRFGLYFRGGRDNNAAMVFAIVWLGSIAVYIISFLLTRALSRYREFAADRSAAYLTGRPNDLSSALIKVSGDIAQIPTKDLRQAQPAQAFMFAPGKAITALLSTHPTTEKRVEKLAEISRQLGREL